jgi:hypothetical protein
MIFWQNKNPKCFYWQQKRLFFTSHKNWRKRFFFKRSSWNWWTICTQRNSLSLYPHSLARSLTLSHTCVLPTAVTHRDTSIQPGYLYAVTPKFVSWCILALHQASEQGRQATHSHSRLRCIYASVLTVGFWIRFVRFSNLPCRLKTQN